MVRTGLFAAALVLAASAFSSTARAETIDPAVIGEPDECGYYGIPESGKLAFNVYRGSSRFGTHTITFTDLGDCKLQVDVAIDLKVDVLFVTAFRYTHRNTEIWQNGQLISLESTTDDDGTPLAVDVDRNADGSLRIFGTLNQQDTAPADLIPTSYWNQVLLTRSELLNSQNGKIFPVTVESEGTKQIEGDGGTVSAQSYIVQGTIRLELLYDENGVWAGCGFDARGAQVRYERIEA